MKFPFRAWFIVAIIVAFVVIAIVSSYVFIRSVLISDLDLWPRFCCWSYGDCWFDGPGLDSVI